MVISRTPFRVSFFGGGTDYPAWYRQHGGCVLTTTIDKYCYLTCRYLPPFFGNKFRIVYSKIESCQTVNEIAHPAVREVIRYLNIDRGLEIHHDGDLPARSGIGSSSAFTVGLLHALYALKGYMPNKRQLAYESIYLEQEVMKETVGSQDQVQTAYGGFNHITFGKDGEISVKPMTLSSQRVNHLQDHLMLFYTGVARTASEVAKSYVDNIDQKKRQLNILQNMVEEAISILIGNRDINQFGKLLNKAWEVKYSLSPMVSTSFIDNIYQQALSSGAIGGKLIGAGGGGFLLLFVPPSHQSKVRDKLKKLIFIPFRFESFGSQIIFFSPEQDYLTEKRRRKK